MQIPATLLPPGAGEVKQGPEPLLLLTKTLTRPITWVVGRTLKDAWEGLGSVRRVAVLGGLGYGGWVAFNWVSSRDWSLLSNFIQ